MKIYIVYINSWGENKTIDKMFTNVQDAYDYCVEKNKEVPYGYLYEYKLYDLC